MIGVALGFSMLGLQYAAKSIRSNAENELRLLSVVLSRQVQRHLSRVEESLTSLENHGFLVEELRKPTPDRAAVEDFLQNRLKMLPLFEDLAVFNRQGACVGATDPEWYEIQAKQQPFYLNGLRVFNFSDIFTSEDGKVQLVSTPITNGSVNKGVLVGQLNMSSLYDLLDQKLGVSLSTDAFLIDSAMRFITPGRDATERQLESHLIATPLLKHLKDEFWVDQYRNFNGKDVLGTVLKIPGRRWHVVVERDLAEVTRPINSAKVVILAATVALAIVLVLVTLLVTRSITGPLNTLVAGAQRVARGDVTTAFEIPRGLDEVSFLAQEFDRMRAKVAASQERLIERLEESERRRLESERLAAIGSLASTMAHEIRNPLNAMSLLLARMELSKGHSHHAATAEERRVALVGDLRREIARLDRLVSDILDYARPLQLHLAETDLVQLAESTLHLYRGLFEGKGISWSLAAPDGPQRLMIDADRVKQCLVNLLQNAAEAVEAGRGRVDVRISRCLAPSGDGEAVDVQVVDNGSGLPQQPEGRLFDLFFTTKDTGTGLGLSTVKKIMDAHRGRITLTARPPGEDGSRPPGTVARLAFPFDSQK